MEVSTRPAYKLFPRMQAFRRRHLRHARSQDLLSPDVTLANPPEDEKVLSDESLIDPDPPHRGSSVPPYTPMPVPARVSSARKEAMVYSMLPNGRIDSIDHQEPTAQEPPPETIEGDNVSVDFSAFDDNLLHPGSPVSSQGLDGHERGRRRNENVKGGRPGLSPSDIRTDGQANSHRKLSSAMERMPSTSSRPSHRKHRICAPPALDDEALAKLQDPSPDKSDILDTELTGTNDPDTWDVIKPFPMLPHSRLQELYSLEKRAEQLYSAEHLRIILEDPKFLFKFSGFLRKYRSWRVRYLSYYMEAIKATRSLEYTRILVAKLAQKALPDGKEAPPLDLPRSENLSAAADAAFEELLKDDLHYYIAQQWVKIVSSIVQRRITGTLPTHLREASNGLAEVFCITDPSRRDNPIILASDGFTRHSGCGLEYVLGRNCRFMQGPGTTVDSCRRFAISTQEVKDHTEIFVNYRRDGSPFLSLVMNAPLVDSQGTVRYFLGAQVDVSGLLKTCSGLESLKQLVQRQQQQQEEQDACGTIEHNQETKRNAHREILALGEMFNAAELDIIRKYGGSLQRGQGPNHDPANKRNSFGPDRVLIDEGTTDSSDAEAVEPSDDVPSMGEILSPISDMNGTQGNLSGVYKYYLLMRPAPSLRILFASSTLCTPNLLQSPFLEHIGGQSRMREKLDAALKDCKPVTARVRWRDDGGMRWLHCTPLWHYRGQIGLWMVVVVFADAGEVGGGVVRRRAERMDSALGRRE